MSKIHAGHIEVAVAKLLNYRVYTIVPNVSWGLGLNHECDMLALKDGKFTEIEIKVTASDLKKDFEKWHGHDSEIISRLVYAMPERLTEKYSDLIPRHCGIIRVSEIEFETPMRIKAVKYRAAWVRQCRHNSNRPTQTQIENFIAFGLYADLVVEGTQQPEKIKQNRELGK